MERRAAPFARACSARLAWKSTILARSDGSAAARMRTARSPALRAPPTATVATGMPAGICTIDNSESSPSRCLSGTGTPITGAAHLPGMLASVTPLPVIGVPVPLKHLDGLDSLLSIVQMPAGIPVATVAVGGARNAGLLAVRILAAADPSLRARMIDFQASLAEQARAKGAALRSRL